MRLSRAALLVAPLLLAAEVGAQGKKGKTTARKPSAADAQAAAARQAEDDRARAAFATLTPAEQSDLLGFFALEAGRVDTLQGALVRFVLKHQDVDSGQWPEYAEPPVFDPAVHAPGQPIARRLLDPGSTTARAFRERVLADVPARSLASAWRYDPAARELRRIPGAQSPERRFANALGGMLPDADLAEALVERALDDGTQQKALAAFDHAYTDREGNVYPGVTLYDAWSGGIEIEMPDVDTLGIVHTVLGDWKTWVAPVDAAQHDSLYAKIGAIYTAAHRHRGLRRALAQTFLVGIQSLGDGYGAQLDNLHALWDAHESTPQKLAPKLPGAKDWTKFLDDWAKRCKREGKLFQAGLRRRAELDANAAAVRAVLLRALEEFGAYARLNKPKVQR